MFEAQRFLYHVLAGYLAKPPRAVRHIKKAMEIQDGLDLPSYWGISTTTLESKLDTLNHRLTGKFSVSQLIAIHRECSPAFH